jgi:hypothetical protein
LIYPETEIKRTIFFLQLSENSSLLSGEDATSERVRFDDNVSFIDDISDVVGTDANNVAGTSEQQQQQNSQITRLLKVKNWF